MKVEHFTRDARVYHTIEDLKASWSGKQVSDIVDREGHQYVDLVMEGGGVLGIALVGYTYTLEQVGIRFLGIGGTSAGSINALLLAAIDDKHNPKSEVLIDELANKDFYDFVDGGNRVRRFIDVVLNNPGWLAGSFNFLRVRRELSRHWGLNPGDALHEWISGILGRYGIADTASLMQRVSAEPPGGFRWRYGELPADSIKPRLSLIAADVSTETKVEFPRMAGLFWNDPETVNPADFVRASMSIPGFFQPFKVQNIPSGTDALDRWAEMAGYKDRIPQECCFVDGGVMSNFPIDIFHKRNSVPRTPTFGAKLGEDNRYQPVDGPLRLAGAVFNSARHCLDYDFLTRNPDYRQLVTWIDTRDHNWLNFSLTDDEKLDLFRCGVVSAAAFLSTFNWDRYKETRGFLADAQVVSDVQRDAVKQANEASAEPLEPSRATRP